MDWEHQIKLIRVVNSDSTDSHGFPITNIENETIVFARKKSIGYREFYSSQIAGYEASIKFDIYAAEYSGETKIEYPVDSGTFYKVLRTYEHDKGELLELTLVVFNGSGIKETRNGTF